MSSSHFALLDYLTEAKVKVIDDDCFPTNKYSKHIMEKECRT